MEGDNSIGFQPDDDRLDPTVMYRRWKDFVEDSELDAMLESDHWWPVVESVPMTRTTTESYHAADLRGKADLPSPEKKPKKKAEAAAGAGADKTEKPAATTK